MRQKKRVIEKKTAKLSTEKHEYAQKEKDNLMKTSRLSTDSKKIKKFEIYA